MHYDSELLYENVYEYAQGLLTYYGNEVRVFEDDDSVQVISDNVPKAKLFPGPYDVALRRLPYGEQVGPFYDRSTQADYTNYTADVINKLVGILSSVDVETQRTWQKKGETVGLESNGAADRLKENCDGNGTDWSEKWERVAVRLLIFGGMFVLVDGVGDDGQSKMKMVDPRQVVDWKEEAGKLQWVKVRHTVQIRSGPKSAPVEEERYILYDLEGFQAFRKNDDGEVESVGEKTEYAYYTDESRNERRLPIERLSLGLPFNFGLTLAQKTNRIFQKQSERDHMQRLLKNNLFMMDADDDAFRNAKKYIMQGGKVLQGKGSFESPSTDPIDSAGEVIREKIKDLYETFFLGSSDSSREKSATQIRQEYRVGLESILNILAGRLDSAEQNVLRLVEQVYFPENPRVWGQATVSRSKDFQPTDTNTTVQRLQETFFRMEGVPLPDSVKTRVASRILDLYGIEYDEDEMELGVGDDRRARLQEDAFDADIDQTA